MVIWVVLLLLYAQSISNIGAPLLPANLAMRIFIRSLLIILTYYFVIGPSLTWLMSRWLKNRKLKENELIQKILQLLPDLKQLTRMSWQLTAKKTGGKRILLFGEIVLLNTVYAAHD